MVLIRKVSSHLLPAHWAGGTRARNLAAHFALQNTNPVGAKSDGAAEGGPVAVRVVRVLAIPGIRMRVELDHRQWPVLSGMRPQERQRDGVVTA